MSTYKDTGDDNVDDSAIMRYWNLAKYTRDREEEKAGLGDERESEKNDHIQKLKGSDRHSLEMQLITKR